MVKSANRFSQFPERYYPRDLGYCWPCRVHWLPRITSDPSDPSDLSDKSDESDESDESDSADGLELRENQP
jgi:hypothetical protein